LRVLGGFVIGNNESFSCHGKGCDGIRNGDNQ
jgi:hypothetical protein